MSNTGTENNATVNNNPTDSNNPTDNTGAYPLVAYPGSGEASPRFPDLEQAVLKQWDSDGTFRKSIEQRADAPEFVFYDGPPFANGLPHYGHLLTGYVKDLVPRYQTMRGKKVDRRFGWDCHGLPAEVEAEKQLGITHKSEIDSMGIAEFNDACRTSVLRYTREWEEYVTRQARWVDFENDYKTLDTDYMESVMWAFKTLWDKGLVYEGFRVLWYCWRCETPLSATETKMDDVYQMRQDPAVTVAMPLHDSKVADGALNGASALIWTTTPWTLPSNLAMAVHPDIDYVQVRTDDGERYLLAAARLEHYARELGKEPVVLSQHKGAELVGVTYDPPFSFFVGRPNAHQILAADYVTTGDGTGIVHIAPAFGEDDKAVTDAAGIEVVVPVDPRGEFTNEVTPYAGMQVFEANKPIIADLKQAGILLRHETYDHTYPHCWRCGTPLMQKAVSSWFVDVPKIRDRMVELNQKITWVPEHIKDGQFGKWLEGARDWSISRNRYWGSPIPVWTSDDPAYPRVDVYGSLDDLERDFGVRPKDLHRPHIDELVRPNPDDPTGKSVMRRVPEVLDCWFESGSMPFAQVHYPFENREWFENHYPGDFIVEYNGQTRGWFYTLHVLATALFDSPSFRTVVAHGIVLGDDGLKMSKSKGNYPDVNEVFNRDGSDAMRWFLMSSPILRGGNLVVTEQGIREGVRQAQLPLWNAWSFLRLYAERPATWSTGSQHVLDRYILAKLRDTRDTITDALDNNDIATACDAVRLFSDALTNWYVRRSRSRFWEGQESQADAFNTLHTVLEVLCRLSAPLLPLVTEVIWRGLTGGESVHLTDWPEADELPADPELVAAMDEARSVCSAVLSVRKAQKLRVRLPLASLTIAAEDAERLKPFAGIIANEVNVKHIELTSDVDVHGRFELAVNARAAGPRLGKDVQKVIRAVKSGDWVSNPDGTVTAAGIVLQEGEFTQRLVAAEPESTAPLPGGGGLVVLDLDVTETLEAEGWAKDRIRELQEARRTGGLDVSDRIAVTMAVPEHRVSWAEQHRDLMAREVLAVEFDIVTQGAATSDAGFREIGDGVSVRLTLQP
ncbi:isoleucine--tRNA ligase [Hoyosella rhizosphaerae]|uniref:Isoleucine--tRNA ligase n=1 Tax=Hoyosella rhizosphaerae TaxID=1755582 RepID=A0A916UFA6_9ACTN|nr:isoleucine--tRNA ligase [Hoyosella rhizosphaerae]MBN4927904.1 isoleucine--tRNA ligase [Hoyosella rhizosphaerae]GGC70890.1 isoleucine--tRNA ligase [Hoyosella rhizosphaerae]